MRNALRFGGILIGLYLVVQYSTGSGRVITAATSGATNVVKSLQGR